MSVKVVTKESTREGLLYLFDSGNANDETHEKLSY